MSIEATVYIMAFAFGACFGSFSNVCILRIPEKQSLMGHSSCPGCGRKLKWYELFPVFSYIALKGKCLGCKSKISLQYPLIEAASGMLWVLACASTLHLTHAISLFGSPLYGFLAIALLRCLMASALLIIAVIDIRTMEIPPALNWAILALGALMLLTDLPNWFEYLLGAVAVSGVLLLLWFITGGRALGGGDIKLMAVCGLFLGWKLIIVAFLMGCVIGSVVHVVRMLTTKAGRVLAFGPYLALGVYITMLCGNVILDWYLGLYNFEFELDELMKTLTQLTPRA